MGFFKRADEMEMAINFKAMRLAWVFENLALLAWAVLSWIRSDGDVFTLIMIIAAQNVIFFGSKLYMTRQMSGDGHEK